MGIFYDDGTEELGDWNRPSWLRGVNENNAPEPFAFFTQLDDVTIPSDSIFSWGFQPSEAVIPTPDEYWLQVGLSRGAKKIYNQSAGSAKATEVIQLPREHFVYARLWYRCA